MLANMLQHFRSVVLTLTAAVALPKESVLVGIDNVHISNETARIVLDCHLFYAGAYYPNTQFLYHCPY